VKRIFSKYISVVLLLCLVIQITPLSLLHSHENQLTEVGHDINSMYADNEYIDDIHHDSEENECSICKIQQSLNNQAYTFGDQIRVFSFLEQSSVSINLEVSIDDHLIKSTSGRAPPIA